MDVFVVGRALVEAARVRLPEGTTIRATNTRERMVVGSAPPTESETAEGRIVVKAEADPIIVGMGADVTSSLSHHLLVRRGNGRCFINIIAQLDVPRQVPRTSTSRREGNHGGLPLPGAWTA